MKFTVSGLTGSVTGAKLRAAHHEQHRQCHRERPGCLPDRYRLELDRTTGITWSNRPARTSAVLEDKGALAANTWVEYNVSAAGITGNGDYAFVVVAHILRRHRLLVPGGQHVQTGAHRHDRDRRRRHHTAGHDHHLRPFRDRDQPQRDIRVQPARPASTFACSLDGAPYATCDSPRTYSGLSCHGAHVRRACDRRCRQYGSDACDAELDRLFDRIDDRDVPAYGRRAGGRSQSDHQLRHLDDAEGGRRIRSRGREQPEVHRVRPHGLGDRREAAAAHHEQHRQCHRRTARPFTGPVPAGLDRRPALPGATARLVPAQCWRTRAALAANTWVEYNVSAAGITGNGDLRLRRGRHILRRHRLPRPGRPARSNRNSSSRPVRCLAVGV